MNGIWYEVRADNSKVAIMRTGLAREVDKQIALDYAINRTNKEGKGYNVYLMEHKLTEALVAAV